MKRRLRLQYGLGIALLVTMLLCASCGAESGEAPGTGSSPGTGPLLSLLAGIPEDPISQALSVLEQSDSPFEVLQARKAFEIGVASLAVEVADDEDIRMIKKRWDEKYEKGRRGDYVAYTRYGKEFHLAIAHAY